MKKVGLAKGCPSKSGSGRSAASARSTGNGNRLLCSLEPQRGRAVLRSIRLRLCRIETVRANNHRFHKRQILTAAGIHAKQSRMIDDADEHYEYED